MSDLATSKRCPKCGSHQDDIDYAQRELGAGCPNYGCPMVPFNGLEGPARQTAARAPHVDGAEDQGLGDVRVDEPIRTRHTGVCECAITRIVHPLAIGDGYLDDCGEESDQEGRDSAGRNPYAGRSTRSDQAKGRGGRAVDGTDDAAGASAVRRRVATSACASASPCASHPRRTNVWVRQPLGSATSRSPRGRDGSPVQTDARRARRESELGVPHGRFNRTA